MPKSILITGSSTGIGKKAALCLKERGYRVFAGLRKTSDIMALQALGLETVMLDVNDSASIETALAEVLQKTGGTLDALFNNAGYLQAGAIEDLTRDLVRAQFETNVFGSMELIQRVLPIMRKQGHGRIIQNSSILGIVTIPYCGAYNASKFAIEGFCNTLRQELHHTSIHVSLINPGPIKTKLRENARTQFVNSLQGQQTGHYQSVYENLERNYFDTSKRKDNFDLEPEAVVKSLIHALEHKRPHAHYFVGIAAKGMALLRRILPDCLLDKLLIKFR
jgi:NAD(P)-dependent dehydrogenase (short-subunit alcohol dehydrogenase family)